MTITKEALMATGSEGLHEKSLQLKKEDIIQLVDWLSLKEDDIRYQAFLLLQARSRLDNSVYPFWDTFHTKLRSDNSYQRSLGVMLIAENIEWDSERKMKDTLADYLELLKDEKPVTVRQCIQALRIIAQKEPEYNQGILKALLSYNIMAARDTMRKLILFDIINTLLEIRKNYDSNEISNYIFNALSGEILDAKSKKAIEKQL